MEGKNKVVFEYEKSGRICRFEVPIDTPLGEAYEAASAFFIKVTQLINDQAEKVQPKEEKVEEVVEEK